MSVLGDISRGLLLVVSGRVFLDGVDVTGAGCELPGPEVLRARRLAVETERLALRAVLLRRRPTVDRILSRALKLARVSLKEARQILPPTAPK